MQTQRDTHTLFLSCSLFFIFLCSSLSLYLSSVLLFFIVLGFQKLKRKPHNSPLFSQLVIMHKHVLSSLYFFAFFLLTLLLCSLSPGTTLHCFCSSSRRAFSFCLSLFLSVFFVKNEGHPELGSHIHRTHTISSFVFTMRLIPKSHVISMRKAAHLFSFFFCLLLCRSTFLSLCSLVILHSRKSQRCDQILDEQEPRTHFSNIRQKHPYTSSFVSCLFCIVFVFI